MNHYIKKGLLLLAIVAITISCNRVKTTSEVKETHADGKPKRVVEYITDANGQKKLHKETCYFPSEKKYISGTYDDKELRNGTWTSWYENGQKNSEQNYTNGKSDGMYNVWHPDGKQWIRVNYNMGKEDGVYNIWHPNGKQQIKGEYNMGKKVGVWTYYDTLGKVMREEDYDKK